MIFPKKTPYIRSYEPMDGVQSLVQQRRCVAQLLTEMIDDFSIELLQHDQFGKPYIVNSEYQISISHTCGYVAVMISDKYPVGVDIELLGDKVLRVKDRFLCCHELELLSLDVYHLSHVFWSAKETAYKAVGVPDKPITDYLITKIDTYNHLLFIDDCLLIHYDIHSHYVITWTIIDGK